MSFRLVEPVYVCMYVCVCEHLEGKLFISEVVLHDVGRHPLLREETLLWISALQVLFSVTDRKNSTSIEDLSPNTFYTFTMVTYSDYGDDGVAGSSPRKESTITCK